MPTCEKCWGDAYVRSLGNGTSQAENYSAILKERADTPCTQEEQDGQFYERRQSERGEQTSQVMSKRWWPAPHSRRAIEKENASARSGE